MNSRATFGITLHLPAYSQKELGVWKKIALQSCDIALQLAEFQKVTSIQTDVIHQQQPKIMAWCEVKGVTGS